MSNNNNNTMTESFDNRAVSPVIGVILMVAITVILAATVGTFVLQLGQDAQGSTPDVSATFSDADFRVPSNESNLTAGDNLFVVRVMGVSEQVTLDNYQLRLINESSGESVNFLGQDLTDEATFGGQDVRMSYNGHDPATEEVSGDEDLTPGDTFIIQAGSGVAANNTINDGTDYRIQIVFDSGTDANAIAQGVVELR